MLHPDQFRFLRILLFLALEDRPPGVAGPKIEVRRVSGRQPEPGRRYGIPAPKQN